MLFYLFGFHIQIQHYLRNHRILQNHFFQIHLSHFLHKHFEQYLYFNLEKNQEVRNIFEKTIDEEKILEELELYIGKKIDLEKTLLFFDEVQVSENFIVSLKYFNESEKPYKIVCAGSLLRSKNK